MTFKEILTKIDTLQEQIKSFGEIDKEVLKKVHYKFRLDWNFYSNSMEGGTLTREETRSVMTSVLNISNKSIKDLNEMVGHNNIVEEVFSIGKGEKRLSEKRIKEIHKAIIFEEDPDKKLMVGEWKSYNNEIINYKGEKIKFAPFDEVPEKIHSLLNNLNAFFDAYFMEKTTEHPLKMAAQFHIDFLSVHPFHDGNGRVSRILSNLILISCGYPPFIIKTSQKDTYNRLLSDIQMYGGSAVLFYTFIGERIIESQEIILKAINGEDIEDENDLEKEIELLKRKQTNIQNDPKRLIKYKDEVIDKVYLPFILEVDNIGTKYTELFNGMQWKSIPRQKYRWSKLINFSTIIELKSFFSKEISNLDNKNSGYSLLLILNNYKSDHFFSIFITIEIIFNSSYFELEYRIEDKLDNDLIDNKLFDDLGHLGASFLSMISINSKEEASKETKRKAIHKKILKKDYISLAEKIDIKLLAKNIGKDIMYFIKSEI